MTTTKIAIRAKQNKLKIKEIYVDFLKRSSGKGTISHIPAIFQGIKEMLKFKFKHI